MVARPENHKGNLKLRAAYEASLTRTDHIRDAMQSDLVTELETLQAAILRRAPKQRSILRWFRGRRSTNQAAIKGIYIWGGVGRGKTFLMDLFFDSLPTRRKRRVHFHRLMQDVHRRLAKLTDTEDPLAIVAADIARKTQVLCFDEFYVSDIGDAMILSRLLDGLFRNGVILVTTSNAKPDDLYIDGLQRQQFLPAIDLLKQHTTVFNLDGDTDYRLRLLQKAGTFLTPDDPCAREKLETYFRESASSAIRDNGSLTINSREIATYKRAKGIVWFDFAAICDGPRSQADYIEIARWYPSVIISGVPQFHSGNEDPARRFIALVDEFYDRHVKLVLSAATRPERLYVGTRLKFEFERTLSRLIEMQSGQYLALPHLA
jgi:cell division protein ZapE